MDTNNQDQKLSAIIQQLNSESAARGNAFATLNQRINALEKLVAEQGDDLAKESKTNEIRHVTAMADIYSTKSAVKALQEAQSVAALALEVSNIRSVLTQLLEALAEDEDAAVDDDGEHTLEQVKRAYLAIVSNDADELTIAHIETADTVAFDGADYRLINTTHGRNWTISRDLVAELLAGEDDQ